MIARTMRVATMLLLTVFLSYNKEILADDATAGISALESDRLLEAITQESLSLDKNNEAEITDRRLSSSTSSEDDDYYGRKRVRRRRRRRRQRNRRKNMGMRRAMMRFRMVNQAITEAITTATSNRPRPNRPTAESISDQIFGAPQRWTGLSSWTHWPANRNNQKMMWMMKRGGMYMNMMNKNRNQMFNGMNTNKMMRPMGMKMTMFRNVMNMMGGNTMRGAGMKRQRMIMNLKNNKPMQLTWNQLRQRRKNMGRRERNRYIRRQRRMRRRRRQRNANQDHTDSGSGVVMESDASQDSSSRLFSHYDAST